MEIKYFPKENWTKKLNSIHKGLKNRKEEEEVREGGGGGKKEVKGHENYYDDYLLHQ